MKRRHKIVLSIILILVVAFSSQAIMNRQYVSNVINNKNNYIEIDSANIQMANWTPLTENIFVSEEDPQIIIDTAEIETIHKIEIQGSVGNRTLTPVAYYKSDNFPEFSENTRLDLSLKEKDGNLIIKGNFPKTNQIRIDITEEPGLELKIDKILLHTEILQIWWLVLLMSITVTFIFLLIISIPIESYKRLPIYLQGFKKYTFLLQNLVKKDITTKYRRSVLGILWSVLNPLLMMMVITAVFQHLFRSNIENFPIYYLTGSLIFNFTVEATSLSMNSMIDAAPLLKKVYIPKYIFPMEKCFFALINMLFSFIAVIIIHIVLKVVPPITILLFPIPIIYTFIFSLGFGLILATLNVFFRDVSHLYTVFTTAWIYLTPIMYPIEILPRAVSQLIRLNPLYYYVNCFRNLTMYGIVPSLRDNLICAFFSFSFLIVGIFVFKKNQDKFVLYL